MEHGEAVEYELLSVGLRREHLGTKRLTWRELKVVVTCSPPGGALHRAVDPKGARWTPDTYMLANLVDLSQVRIWQSGSGKGPKPKPLLRPNEKPKKRKSLTQEAIEKVTRNG